ncbi:MAG TPA: peptide-methionine (S)-S-oxide reductase MsrA, partial [Candidatus Acidoferrum sp.]|nr:peptide-methionine (S)-S-oxide reductase MsrA [Candidatus Acidoferrum sp.]
CFPASNESQGCLGSQTARGVKEMKQGRGFRIATIAVAGVLAVLFGASGAIAARTNTTFPMPAVDEPVATARSQEVAVLSGGCFWGMQAVYQHTRGVVSATSGYSGGEAETAHYELVGRGDTGHAESVKVVFDPSQITYGQVLMIFFSVAHNPTELNKQGPDWGPQYRSAVFYSSEEQKRIAQAYVAQLDAAKVYPQKIVTQVVPFKAFYPAESYHQNYLKHHMDSPYIQINDLPKIAELKKQFPQLYREY